MPNGTIDDEREVLEVLFRLLHVRAGQVVRATTLCGWRGEAGEERAIPYLRDNLADMGGETLADFLVKNCHGHPVNAVLGPERDFLYLDDGAFRDVFRDADGWARFRRTFPESDGTLRFSRVGLDRETTQAVVYAGQQFDWNLGSGGYWLLSRRDGVWTWQDRAGTWMS